MYHNWGHAVILNEAVTTFETTSVAAAVKVETCHYCLQVSNIVIHIILLSN